MTRDHRGFCGVNTVEVVCERGGEWTRGRTKGSLLGTAKVGSLDDGAESKNKSGLARSRRVKAELGSDVISMVRFDSSELAPRRLIIYLLGKGRENRKWAKVPRWCSRD